MATGGDLVTRLRELLQDPAGAGAHWSDAFLQGCIERGNDALYPMVYEAKTDTSLTTVAGQLEYSLPSGIPTDVGFSPLRQVYLAPAAGAGVPPEAVYGWRVDEGRRKLVLAWTQPAGRALHVVYMGRLNKLNDATDSFEGSSAAETCATGRTWNRCARCARTSGRCGAAWWARGGPSGCSRSRWCASAPGHGDGATRRHGEGTIVPPSPRRPVPPSRIGE
jgi:hypothetical protein